MKKFNLAIIFFLFHWISFGQTDEITRLKQWGKVILSQRPDSIRLTDNKKFLTVFDSLIHTQKANISLFDSIKNFSILTTKDSTLQVLTWIFPYDNQTYRFYGYLRYLNKVDSTWEVQKLTDKHLNIQEIESKTLSPEQWFGALYYQLIEQDSCYTLLGWNGYNQQQNIKVIDVLWFDKNNQPKFGKPIFTYPEEKEQEMPSKKRVVLIYANDASITLRYEKVWRKETIKTASLYNPYQTKKTLQNLIFFNRLNPINPMFEGDRRYYYPTTEVIDGYKPMHGKWIFQENMIIFPNQ